MIPRFFAQYEKPTGSQSQIESIFNNLVDIEINKMGVTPTSDEIKLAINNVQKLAQESNVREDIAAKRISGLLKDYEAARKRESEYQNFESIVTSIDNRLKNPAYLKSPINYFNAKLKMLDSYATMLSDQYESAIEDNALEKIPQIEQWMSDINNMRFQSLTALRNVGANPDAVILIADVDPYSQSIYNGRYVTPEEYQNKYKTSYYQLEGAKSETGTQIAINKSNLRKFQITLGNTTWELPVSQRMSQNEILLASAQARQAGQKEIDLSSILQQDIAQNTLVKVNNKDIVSTIPIRIYDVIQPGHYAVSSDNQAIYTRDSINGPLKKIKVPNASAYLDELNKFYVKPFNQDMENEWNMQSINNVQELQDISTSSISSLLTFQQIPQQQLPEQPQQQPITIRGGRCVTGTPQKPRSNVWKTAGSIFRGIFPPIGITGFNR